MDMQRENLLDVLLDESHAEDIIIFRGEDGVDYEFEQVATIYHADRYYAILTLANKTEDEIDDEAIVFRVVEDDGNQHLEIEDDEEIAMAVFSEYVKLYEEQYGEDEVEH